MAEGTLFALEFKLDDYINAFESAHVSGRPTDLSKFLPERDDRIDAGGLVSRYVTGRERSENQSRADGHECDRVISAYAEEHGRHEARRRDRRAQAENYANHDHQQRLSQDHPDDVRTARTERHPNADLLGAPSGRI